MKGREGVGLGGGGGWWTYRKMWWGESKAAERRGPVQCRTGTDTLSSAFLGLPWKPYSSPACIPTDCSGSLSIYLSSRFSVFHAVFFIPLLICVFISSLFLFSFCTRTEHILRSCALSKHTDFRCTALCDKVNGQLQFSIPLHSQTHKHFVVFSPSLYFYSPFCSASCFSNAPSSHLISAHTQGTLASFLLCYGICHGPAAPSSHFSKCFHLPFSF